MHTTAHSYTDDYSDHNQIDNSRECGGPAAFSSCAHVDAFASKAGKDSAPNPALLTLPGSKISYNY